MDDNVSFDKCNVHYLTSTKKYIRKFKNIKGYRHKYTGGDQFKRYEQITDWAFDLVKDCDAIFLEGYSMASKGRVFDIAECTGILKYKIWKAGIPLHISSPTTIKKHVVIGNADKDLLYQTFVEYTDIHLMEMMNAQSVISPISDIIDSFNVLHHCVETYIKESVNV